MKKSLRNVFAVIFTLIIAANGIFINIYYADSGSMAEYDSDTISLARLFTELPDEDYDMVEVNAILDRIALIPPRILDKLMDNGEGIRLVSGRITDETEYTHLRGVVPRGWESTGLTWDDVPGVGGRPIIVRIGYSEMGKGHGSHNLELHEISHRIDAITSPYISNTADFQSIWKEESDEVFGSQSNAFYFLDYSEEYFAEAYTMYLLNAETSTQLRDNAPKTVKLFEELGLGHMDKPDFSLYRFDDEKSTISLSNSISAEGYDDTAESSAFSEGDNLYISFGITNYGLDASKPAAVVINVNGSEKLRIESPVIDEGDMTRFWNVDLGVLKAGVHEISISVDADNAVAEVNEKNNSLEMELEVKGNITSDIYNLNNEKCEISDIALGTSVDVLRQNIHTADGLSVNVVDGVSGMEVDTGLVKSSMKAVIYKDKVIINEFDLVLDLPFEYGTDDWAVPELIKAVNYDLVPPELLEDKASNITREEFSRLSVILYEVLSGKTAEPAASDTFIDTDSADVLKAYNIGITNGIGSGRFGPSNSITRQEICVMISRALKAINPDINTAVEAKSYFTDQEQIDQWALSSVILCHKEKIVNNVGQGRFNPKGNTTRQEAIIMLMRAYESLSASNHR
ncbi:MAG: anthrax toxin lethal factor-related metalloendopeptidase [Bacillota bacterium]